MSVLLFVHVVCFSSEIWFHPLGPSLLEHNHVFLRPHERMKQSARVRARSAKEI